MNTAQTPGATRSAPDAHARGPRFAPSLIVLHWLIALIIIGMLGVGLYMVGLPKGLPFKATLINFHKSLGMTVFLLVLIRIVVRMAVGRPALPPMRAWQRAAARITQVLLYVGMIVMPLTGYLGSSFNSYGTRFWGILLPKWGWDDKGLRSFFFGIHEVCAWIMIALIALHIAGALKHQLIDRDGLLARMLP
ncbi:cytochrome b [Paraburkholderia saeva]|uniref:Cytochrome b561 n=1 Tax=Paraburkholderia saeva TaxID=2777537 RepID=A0A9N8RVJ7_9BURK|nr:cytochrome b [Paraburkholderia saeva]CAG4897626.1 Cytochrome b561 [Paraburkholderia saeva]CAG4913450.1 Cytochrome b561 [Paraburkholderia saeva]CAG4919492.1 Cytochrome b561 [Paraburkholderia saeva]